MNKTNRKKVPPIRSRLHRSTSQSSKTLSDSGSAGPAAFKTKSSTKPTRRGTVDSPKREKPKAMPCGGHMDIILWQLQKVLGTGLVSFISRQGHRH